MRIASPVAPGATVTAAGETAAGQPAGTALVKSNVLAAQGAVSRFVKETVYVMALPGAPV